MKTTNLLLSAIAVCLVYLCGVMSYSTFHKVASSEPGGVTQVEVVNTPDVEVSNISPLDVNVTNSSLTVSSY